MTAEVMRALHHDGGRDLQITDADGTPVPFQRLPERFLTEPFHQRERLPLRASTIDFNEPENASLELELEHQGTRLVVQSPRIERRLGDREHLVFEALIGSPSVPPEMNRHSLSLHFLSPSVPELDCRLRDADDERPPSRRAPLREYGDSRPRQFRASVALDTLPQAWHLACYGNRGVPELKLTDAWLDSSGHRSHRQHRFLQPGLVPDPEQAGVYDFELDAPYGTRALEFESEQPNLVARLRILSRARSDQDWQARGTLTLSTLPGAEAARLELNTVNRHRLWRLVSEPDLRQIPELRVETVVEELAFLAQGTPPWQLFAGSRLVVEPSARIDLLDDTVNALGPAWQWQVLEPRQRAEAAGPGVLEPEPDPVDWSRYLLWIVLISSAALVAWLALKVLNSWASAPDDARQQRHQAAQVLAPNGTTESLVLNRPPRPGRSAPEHRSPDSMVRTTNPSPCIELKGDRTSHRQVFTIASDFLSRT